MSAGALIPPRAEIYRNWVPFDLQTETLFEPARLPSLAALARARPPLMGHSPVKAGPRVGPTGTSGAPPAWEPEVVAAQRVGGKSYTLQVQALFEPVLFDRPRRSK